MGVGVCVEGTVGQWWVVVGRKLVHEQFLPFFGRAEIKWNLSLLF